MEPGKKETYKKYNIDIAISDNYVEKIVYELRNTDINQISYSTENNTIWNRTKQAVVNSATKILGMEPKESYKT